MAPRVILRPESSANAVLVARRARIRERLAARLGTTWPDGELARGVPPETRAALALRAQTLGETRTRKGSPRHRAAVTLDLDRHPIALVGGASSQIRPLLPMAAFSATTHDFSGYARAESKHSSPQAKPQDRAPARWQKARLLLAWTHRPTASAETRCTPSSNTSCSSTAAELRRAGEQARLATER